MVQYQADQFEGKSEDQLKSIICQLQARIMNKDIFIHKLRSSKRNLTAALRHNHKNGG